MTAKTSLKKVLKAICFSYIILVLFSCEKLADMINPPPKEDDLGAMIGRFVKENGTGEGTSWDDAMSPSSFLNRLKTFKAGESVYFAAGTYYTGTSEGEFIEITNSLNLYGGYDPKNTGWDVNMNYPSKHETIFSGDLNKNYKADKGDTRLIEVADGVTLTVKGIVFKNGYAAEGEGRPGIHVKAGAKLKIDYCRFIENESNEVAGGNAGGPALYIKGGIAHCKNTEFSGNKAQNRGGAIRLQEIKDYVSTLILESCLVTDNVSAGDWGGAIQVSGGNCKVSMLNTTVANNHVKKGAAINSGGYVAVINCTIVNNTADDGSQGYQIRCESDNKFTLINSIVTGTASAVEKPDICLNGSTRNIITKGYNVFGFIGGTGKNNFTAESTDKTEFSSNAVFGSNTLADNGGFTKTLALDNNLRGVPRGEAADFMSKYWEYSDYNAEVDQRGVKRTANDFSVGAFEY